MLSVLLFLGVLITGIVCLPHAFSSGALTDFGYSGTGRGYAAFSLVILSPWAFVGFETTSFETAHFKFPIKKSRLLIILSIVAATFAYSCMAAIRELGLEPGKRAYAVIKATEVMVGLGKHLTLSARNQFPGKVVSVEKGAVNSIVKLSVLGGNTMSATISNAAVEELGLAEGVEALAVVKATSVMVGID